MYKNIKIIGFDADDTLWVNETYFREAELEFGQLMQQYETINQIDQELFKIEIYYSLYPFPDSEFPRHSSLVIPPFNSIFSLPHCAFIPVILYSPSSDTQTARGLRCRPIIPPAYSE